MKQLLAILSLLPAVFISIAFAQNPCSELSMTDCISTKGCILDCHTADRKKCSPYHCRPSKEKCENLASQKDLTKALCESEHCIYEPAFCFCPGPMECFCGGGAPAWCHG